MECLFELIKKIANCNCYLLSDNIPVEVSIADNSIGVVFAGSIKSSISEYLLKIRISDDLPERIRRLPVTFIGYRSFRSLIKSEKYPRLLASQGVDYVKLPASVADIMNSFDMVSKCAITDPTGAVKELMPSAGEMTRVESAIIHDLGNFMGSERLLYGACMAGRITGGEAIALIEKIKNAQNNERTLNKFNMAVYRLSENRFDDELRARYDDKDLTVKNFAGNILLIDDLAHLGWSDAIAASLWGSEYTNNDRREGGLLISERKSQGSTFCLRSVSNEGGQKEDDFFNTLKTNIKSYLTEEIDIVLLDLRLRRVKDESTIDPEKTSGIEILQIIRGFNAGIPVIMLTASRRAKNMEKVYDLGADSYFIKERGAGDDKPTDVKDYYNRFIEIINFGLSKAYLGSAWPIIKHIIDNAVTLDVSAEELSCLKKAIALLKKKGFDFEKKELGFDVGGEAVLALDQIKELRKRKIRNSLDGGYLLGGLRNFVAHRLHDSLDEGDFKIALYLAFRLLIEDDNILKAFVEKFIGRKSKLYSGISMDGHSRLANLLGCSHLNALKIDGKDLYPGGLIHDDLKDRKANHYLLFLCRLNRTVRPGIRSCRDHIQADRFVVTRILSSVKGLPSASTSFSGKVSQIGTSFGRINMAGCSEDIMFQIDQIQDNRFRKNIKKGDEVIFDLTINPRFLLAINLKMI